MGVEGGQTSGKLLDLYRTGGLVTTWKIQVLLVFQNFYKPPNFFQHLTLCDRFCLLTVISLNEVLYFDSNFTPMCSYKHDKDPITGINNNPALVLMI